MTAKIIVCCRCIFTIQENIISLKYLCFGNGFYELTITKLFIEKTKNNFG